MFTKDSVKAKMGEMVVHLSGSEVIWLNLLLVIGAESVCSSPQTCVALPCCTQLGVAVLSVSVAVIFGV